MILTPGATLQNGRYFIQSVITQHDIAITYEATHAYLGQIVHIKSFQENLHAQYEHLSWRQHFNQMIAYVAQNSNRHLMPIIDGFEEYGLPWIVVKPCAGQVLATWLLSEPHLSLEQILDLVRPVVAVVHQFHQQGIVHGNITPYTLLLADDAHHLVLGEPQLQNFLPRGAIAPNDFSRYSTDAPDIPGIHHDLQGLATLLFALVTRQVRDIQDLVETLPPFHGQDYPSAVEKALKDALLKGLHPDQHDTVEEWFGALEMALQCACQGGSPDVSEETDVYKGDDFDAANQNTTNPSGLTQSVVSQGDEQIQQVQQMNSGVEEANRNGQTTSQDMTHSVEEARAIAPRKVKYAWRLPVALSLASIAATFLGGYLGFSFRLQEPEQLERSPIFGREIFGSDQSFPESDEWPGKSSYEIESPRFLFEDRLPRPIYGASSESDADTAPPDTDTTIEPTPSTPSEYELLDDVQIGSDFDNDWDWTNTPSIQDEEASSNPSSDSGSEPIDVPPPNMRVEPLESELSDPPPTEENLEPSGNAPSQSSSPSQNPEPEQFDTPVPQDTNEMEPLSLETVS